MMHTDANLSSRLQTLNFVHLKFCLKRLLSIDGGTGREYT